MSEHGYVADLAQNGEDGLYLAKNSDYDLLVLDVMLPGRDGWSLISELRRSGKETPVLFLTARDSKKNRLQTILRTEETDQGRYAAPAVALALNRGFRQRRSFYDI